ncbi:MAG: hypothetical protein JSU63_21670 [Phycisphaerales bacterium]|nr:MAG: hypothetical protein JSU63_21670 [Phycisphaerales bacterium]
MRPDCIGSRAAGFSITLVLATFAGDARAGGGPPGIWGSFESPSGAYSLRIVPEDEYMRAGARYTLSAKGEDVWSARRPYTLQLASVADNGWVVGTANRTSARRAPDTGKRKQFFHVVILDPKGKETLNETIERYPGPSIQIGVPQLRPSASQVLVDTENDRVIVRGQDDHTPGDPRLDFLWFYRLSTGESIKQYRPITGRSSMFDHVRVILGMQTVKGTPLMLIHWLIPNVGARFTLVAPNGDEVWRLDLNEDYRGLRLDRKRGLGGYLSQHPALLRTDIRGQFALRFFADDQRVTFEVQSVEGGKWEVREVSRGEYTEP